MSRNDFQILIIIILIIFISLMSGNSESKLFKFFTKSYNFLKKFGLCDILIVLFFITLVILMFIKGLLLG